MSDELKNCPFCGALNEIRVNENTTSPVMNRPPNVISCDITHWCKRDGLPRFTIKVTGRDREEAIAVWNTRAQPTYNPETHILIAREDVPDNLAHWVRQYHKPDSLKNLSPLIKAASLLAQKCGDRRNRAP